MKYARLEKKVSIGFSGLFAVALGAVVAFSSCTKEEFDGHALNHIGKPKPISVTASLPQTAELNKTTINSDGYVHWESTDEIIVNNSVIGGISINPTDPTRATFEGMAGAMDETGYWGIFPTSIASRTASDYQKTSVKVELPGIQSNAANSGSIPNYMVAYKETSGTDVDLEFKNLCCILKIPVKKKGGPDKEKNTLSYIEVSSTNSIAGEATVNWNNGSPNMNFGSNGKSRVKLDCGSGVELNDTPDTFTIMLPAGTQTFTVKFYDAMNKFMQKTITSVFVRSHIYRMSEVTLNAEEKDPYLPGLYSVSPTLQVRIAYGNLQWSATGGGTTVTTHQTLDGTAPGTFRIAEHQWDYVGTNGDKNKTYGNVPGSKNDSIYPFYWRDKTVYVGDPKNNVLLQPYNGWIDLFNYGTSGYNGVWPDSMGVAMAGSISGTSYDWGVYNAISNAGNMPGMWRTLTSAEWSYMMNLGNSTDINVGRQGSCFAKANVEGVSGFVIFPDNYDSLPGKILATEGLAAINTNGANYPGKRIPKKTWDKMEAMGVMFLPICGKRTSYNFSVKTETKQGVTTTKVEKREIKVESIADSTGNAYGWYWTSTGTSENKGGVVKNKGADMIHICTNHAQVNANEDGDIGCAVRLVMDAYEY